MVAESTVLSVVRAQAAEEADPEVVRALNRVLSQEGNLEKALADLLPVQRGQFGPKSRFLEALVERTFESLLGKEELIEKLETLRRSVLAQAVGGGITAGASIISTATGLQTAAASIVFLYLLPIGVRAAHDAWKARGSGVD